MGVMGQPVKTFAEANLATAVDVSMNDDVPFFWDVVKVEGRVVTLKSHWDGEIIERRIGTRKSGFEQVVVMHSGAYEAIFGTKPRKVFIMPFKGERIQ